jgi:hypothetical protein
VRGLALALCLSLSSPALADVTYTDVEAINQARTLKACELELAATQTQPAPAPVVPVVIGGVVGLVIGVVLGVVVAGAVKK